MVIVITIFIFMVTISSLKVSFRSNYKCDDHDLNDFNDQLVNRS